MQCTCHQGVRMHADDQGNHKPFTMPNKKSTKSTAKRRRMRPTGINEALWACFLDDYLSEEEADEFSKIVGKREDSLWSWANENIPCGPQVVNKAVEEREDPRSRKARGGVDDDRLIPATDGTPAVWSDETSHTLPPVMWLDLPPESKLENEKVYAIVFAFYCKPGDCSTIRNERDRS